MERKNCLKRSILFCLICGDGAWTFFRSCEPTPGKELSEVDLVPILEEKLGRNCNRSDLCRMVMAMPKIGIDERVHVYYEDDDPNCPAIHPDDLEAWLRRAFPELVARKVSA